MNVTQVQPMVRLLLSVGIIFGVLAAVAATSSALFVSDPVVAGASTFATGTADLQIAPDAAGAPGTYGASISGANINGLIPGEEETFTFWLKNASPDMELDLTAELTGVQVTPAETTLAADLQVQVNCNVQNTTLRDGYTVEKALSIWNGGSPEPLAETDNDSNNVKPGRLAVSDATEGEGQDEAKCVLTAMLTGESEASGSSASFDAKFVGTQFVQPTPTPTPTGSPQ